MIVFAGKVFRRSWCLLTAGAFLRLTDTRREMLGDRQALGSPLRAVLAAHAAKR